MMPLLAQKQCGDQYMDVEKSGFAQNELAGYGYSLVQYRGCMLYHKRADQFVSLYNFSLFQKINKKILLCKSWRFWLNQKKNILRLHQIKIAGQKTDFLLLYMGFSLLKLKIHLFNELYKKPLFSRLPQIQCLKHDCSTCNYVYIDTSKVNFSAMKNRGTDCMEAWNKTDACCKFECYFPSLFYENYKPETQPSSLKSWPPFMTCLYIVSIIFNWLLPFWFSSLPADNPWSRSLCVCRPAWGL